MRKTWYLSGVAASLMVACATASLPPVRNLESSDLKLLAGRWEGSALTATGHRVPASWVVKEDGTLTTLSGVGGPLFIQGGKVVLEGAFSDAILTLHEGDGRRILRGPARFRGAGGSGEAQAELVQIR
jgi:hypothetical protein